ncbi:MAG: hypothetical protein R2942_15095, partial [Ignavibacteria bacterium]
MRKLILMLFILSLSNLTYTQELYNSNWTTVGGNSNRTGYDENFFGDFFGFDKTFTAPNSIWGMPIFTYRN